jgi:dTDP-glucose 4,6-dehydratase/UDP-glucose 4-epimerase
VRILITGGTGFIGSALARRLVELGHDVIALDSGSRSRPGSLEGLPIEIRHGDVRDLDAVREAARRVDAVAHLAAIQGTANFYRKPYEVLDVNLRGTLNVAQACAENGVGRLFFSSSSEIYGVPARFPTPESEPAVIPDVLNPRYSYGGSKLAGELIVINAARENGSAYTIVRYHNVYGPNMGWDHVIPQFIERVERGFEFTVQGNGEQTRSFCFISDAIEGSVLAMLSDAGRDRIFNIGNPAEEHSINDLIGLLMDVSGKRIVPRYVPFEGEGTTRRVPDIARARDLLGFRPVVTLSAGLAETYSWYREALGATVRPGATGG